MPVHARKTMPKELVRIDSQVSWLRSEIRPVERGFETTLQFSVNGSLFGITFNALPASDFFQTLLHLRRLSIHEISSQDRGWVEPGRFEIRLNDDDDSDLEYVQADHVQWGAQPE